MIRFEMDVVAADMVERTIEGVIVPYGEVGRIAGVNYRFLPGSVKAARARTPLLLDHDRSRPVGVLDRLAETEKGAVARFRVDTTADGDQALAQAATGSRGALSVGATVEASVENEGVLDVTAGLVHEVSLLALGAFEGAHVTSVAAELEEPPPPAPDPEPEPAPAPEPEPAPTPQEETMSEASAAPPMIIAERGGPPARGELAAGELVTLIIRAQHGEPDARRYLEAALTESPSTGLSGLLPPTYERTVLGGKTIPRPLYDTFAGRPLPGSGQQVIKPVWTTRPAGDWMATFDADPASSAVAIGTQSATVIGWAWAGEFPWLVVERSDPSLIDEVYGEAVQDFYVDVEGKIGGELLAGAAGTSTSLGAAIAEFFIACGRTPDVIVAAPDVWGALADAGELSTPIAGGVPSAGGATLTTTFAGIPIVASGTLAAGTGVLATRRAVDARVTSPVRLTANAIGALNVQLAVVGQGLFDTDYPAELLKITVTPPARAAGSSSPRK